MRVKRFTSETDFIFQPRAMVLGQTINPFYIQPVGEVNTFAIRFYPYGFANFIDKDIKELLNTETPLNELFSKEASQLLENEIIQVKDTKQRICIIENFFLELLSKFTTFDKIVANTVNDIIQTNGSLVISDLLEKHNLNRRLLERKFAKQVGLSPKQLSKVIRLQAALKLLINSDAKQLTHIAYTRDYYDQAHFIKDFQEFTGTNPKNYLRNNEMELSTLFYSKD